MAPPNRLGLKPESREKNGGTDEAKRPVASRRDMVDNFLDVIRGEGRLN